MSNPNERTYMVDGAQIHFSQLPRNDDPAIDQPYYISGSGEEGEYERQTPRKRNDDEEERKTDGASTPSRNGADTPTRMEYIDH